MGVQDFILDRPLLACNLLSRLPSRYWVRQGEKLAVDVANQTIANVKAYQKVLVERNIAPKAISSVSQFKNLPILDKENYVAKYSVAEMLGGGKIDRCYTIERSSGYSGKPQYWPRIAEVDQFFAKYIEIAFNQSYQISTKSTLVILTFALGTWTSGEKTADALRKIASSGRYQMSVITPGANLAESVEILDLLSPQFEQTIIIGYPPFVKSIIDQAKMAKIDLSKIHLRIGLGGESHSVTWRNEMAKKIGLAPNDFNSILNAYGAADVGIGIGREYPISVLIRQLASSNKKLANDLFGQAAIVPGLYQFNNSSYIEEINHELIFTAMNGVPMVRYNIHDRGGVIQYEQMLQILSDHRIDILGQLKKCHYLQKDVWRLPFFYVFGRTDGTVSFGGANIYPENVESALLLSHHNQIINTFKLGVDRDSHQKERLSVHIELNQDSANMSPDEKHALEKALHQIILAKLLEVNQDYSDVYQFDKRSADVRVIAYPFHTGPFACDDKKIKRNYVIK